MPINLKNRLFTFVAIYLISLSVTTTLSYASSASTVMPSLAPMLEGVLPSVVNITTHSKSKQSQSNPLLDDPFFRHFFQAPQQSRPITGSGSGVIIDAKKGHILTNHHLIEEVDEITVTIKDGRQFKAELVGADASTDLALLKIDASDLVAATLGTSSTLRVGDFVAAIGYPFSLNQTVTSGIVSGLSREINIIKDGYEDFIQTDASINPGNSGGALINLKGELIGINTAIYTRSGGNQGIGFAINIDMIKILLPQLIEHGEVKRGLLGVHIQTLTPDLAEAMGIDVKNGAIVTKVMPDSAADKAGIKTNDIITSLNNEDVKSASNLRKLVGLMRVGSKVSLEFYRDGVLKKTKATILKKEDTAKIQDSFNNKFGVRLIEVPKDNHLPAGLEVTQIEIGSKADRAGLQIGDRIVEVNKHPTTDFSSLDKALKSLKEKTLIKIYRDGIPYLSLIK